MQPLQLKSTVTTKYIFAASRQQPVDHENTEANKRIEIYSVTTDKCDLLTWLRKNAVSCKLQDYSPAKSNTMFEKEKLVFLAGATAPLPPLDLGQV